MALQCILAGGNRAQLDASGVTAGSYGPSANATPAHSGTFSVPYVTVDKYGRVTAASTKTITLPSDNNTDTKVTNTLGTTTKAYITGTTSSSTNTGTQIFDTGVYLSTTAGDLTATTFTGSGANLTSLNASNISSGTLAAARLATSGVTAGSYGPSANASPAHSGTFSVPYITVDTYGRVTSASTKTITLPSDNNTDVNVTNTLATTTKAYVTGTTSSSTNTGTQVFDTGVYLDTTAGRLTATTFNGGHVTTTTNPSSSTTYYPTWVSGSGTALRTNNGLRYITIEGAAATDDTDAVNGYGALVLGNSTASGTDANKYGQLRLYGNTAYYYSISGNESYPAANRTLYMPRTTATGRLVALNSSSTAAGSSARPCYVSSSGIATACSSTVGSTDIPVYMDSGTITSSGVSLSSTYKKWKHALIGQNSGDTTKPYYKFAEISLDDTSVSRWITFKVTEGWTDNTTVCGILTALVRTDSSGYWSNGNLVWEYAVSGIDTSDFILAHNTDTNPTVVELWAVMDTAWVCYHFDVISEGTRLSNLNTSAWTLYQTYSAGSESEITADYTQIESTLGKLKNDISGTATKVTYTGSTSGTWYDLIAKSGVTAGGYATYIMGDQTNSLNTHRAYQSNGTTSTVGTAYIQLGNTTASGTAGNAVGILRLYGTSTYYSQLSANASVTANRTLYVPDVSGTIVTQPTRGTAVGSSTRPVYISTTGVATAMTGALSVTYGGTGTTTGEAPSATKLATAVTIDGVSFDGSAAITHYGTCDTATGTAAKEVICDSDFSLVTGARIVVLFSSANTADTPTLNVNSTGAYAVVGYGTTPSSHKSWSSKSLVEFIYDGTSWVILSIGREGYNTIASGNYSHAEGYSTTASASSTHAEGCGTAASGGYSHAGGYYTVASGNQSHAEGYKTEASGNSAHAEGYQAEASGSYSHAEGCNTIASTSYTHAEGYYTTASGQYAHAEGGYTTASGQYSHTGGYYTTALLLNTTIGKRNSTTTAGTTSSTTGDAFIIGNGTSSSALSNAFRVTYAGATYGLSAFNTSGAGYAEFIKEWYDGNPDSEDRVGYFVTIYDGYLYKADESDYIVGITSGNPSVVGNGDENYYWRYERDEFNRFVYEDVAEVTEQLDDEGNPVVDENGDVVMVETGNIIENGRIKISDDYDSTQTYVERKDRPEWDYVGMIGVLPVRDDGTCVAGGYCRCADGGIATKADSKADGTYFVIERITDSVISVILK